MISAVKSKAARNFRLPGGSYICIPSYKNLRSCFKSIFPHEQRIQDPEAGYLCVYRQQM